MPVWNFKIPSPPLFCSLNSDQLLWLSLCGPYFLLHVLRAHNVLEGETRQLSIDKHWNGEHSRCKGDELIFSLQSSALCWWESTLKADERLNVVTAWSLLENRHDVIKGNAVINFLLRAQNTGQLSIRLFKAQSMMIQISKHNQNLQNHCGTFVGGREKIQLPSSLNAFY